MTLREKLMEICTYHADEGTSGYKLSFEEFDSIIKSIKEWVKENRNKQKDLDGLSHAENIVRSTYLDQFESNLLESLEEQAH